MWFVYILRCNDDTLYTGITTDPVRREQEHNGNNRLGAKSLRGKRPVSIIYTEKYVTQGEAKKREAAIKHLPRIEKVHLVNNSPISLH